MHNLTDYPFEIRPLSREEGGGFLINFPDFNECIADGDTIEETICNGMDALQATIAALQAEGLPIPEPETAARIPGNLQQRLADCARSEGVSLDTLITGFLTSRMA